MMKTLAVFYFIALSLNVFAEEPAPAPSASVAPIGRVLEGRLFEKGTKRPIPEANVFVMPSKQKAVTDSEGRFRFESVEPGPIQFVVNLTGYERLDQSDYSTVDGSNPPRELYLEKTTYQVYETTVFGKQQKRDDSTKTLKASQAAQLPGANGDPVKAVQNLPGVSRAAGFSSQIIIQGSAPGDTSYTIDGHEVPIIFHFGGLSSVILPESLDRIDYLSAGYGPEYGRAMGGLVGVWTKKPDRERLRGFAFVDLINSGAALETPIGERGALQVGIRKSYIGEVLKLAMKDDEDFSLTAAPSYSDFTLVYDHEVSSKSDFRLVTVASQDTLEFVLSEPVENDPELRGDFYTKTSFFRLIPQWTHRHGERTTSRWSLGLGRDWVKFVLSDSFFSLQTWSVTTRLETEQVWNDRWTSYFGIDSRLAWANVSLSLPDFFNGGGVANPISTGENRQVSVRASSHNLGGYFQNDVKIGEKWSIRPGARIDYFSTTDEFLPAPRFAARRQLNESTSLKGATGLYYQPAEEQQSSADVGNPDIEAPRSWHAALGVEKDFRAGSSRGFTLTSGPFYRKFEKLVVPSSSFVTRNGVSVPENFNNSGYGKAFGIESQLKFDFAPYSGWLSYTLSRSVRTQANEPEYVSQYDQTHNLNLIGAVDLKRNWRVSSRLRYVTGNPITPVTGSVFDADNDAYIPIRGAYYSQRVNPFIQLDVRVDKKWIYPKWILSAYLDIQNLTNRKNVEDVSYSYNYKQRQDVTGLPVIPTLGVKGEF